MIREISAPTTSKTVGNPGFLRQIETLYLGYWFYVTVLPAYGFSISGLGTIWLWGIGALVLLYVHPILALSSPSVALPFTTTAVMLGIAFGIHDAWGNPMGDDLLSILGAWVINALILSQLVRREGFLKRVTIFMWIVSVALLPRAYGSELDNRLRIEGSALENSNAFAAWIGFPVLGLIMWAYNIRDLRHKAVLWGMAVVIIIPFGLTVSRGSFLALTVAAGLFIVFSLQLPSKQKVVLNFILLGASFFLATKVDIYQEIVYGYTARLEKDTGRTHLWQAALEAINENPAVGVGQAADQLTPSVRYSGTAHNAFLRLMTLAGAIPGVLLGALYLYAVLHMPKGQLIEEVFWLPAMFVYQFIQINTSNWYFVELWAVVTVVYAIDYRPEQSVSQPQPQIIRRPSPHYLG